MSTLSVHEYSTINQLSKSSVYKAIKSGKLPTLLVDGVTHIYIPDAQIFNQQCKDFQLKINHFEELLKMKDQIIESLHQQIKTYQMILPAPAPAPTVVEVVENPKKKKKKKKKEKK